MKEDGLSMEQRSFKRANRALALTVTIDSFLLIIMRLGMILQGKDLTKSPGNRICFTGSDCSGDFRIPEKSLLPEVSLFCILCLFCGIRDYLSDKYGILI